MNRSAPSHNELTDAWTDSDASSDPVPVEELLTVHDAARLLNVSVSWIYEHTRDHVEDRLPFLKLGKYVRFDRADLRAYVDLRVPVKIAQEQLGHASIATTLNIYTHVVDASHRRAIEAVERQLFPTVRKSSSAGSAATAGSVEDAAT